ncbi:MAG: amidohydrolase family protein [Candidatus Accumulibacter sp.]|jgi:mannonate dehydratase|nr:amidohydrolase family protein [Accumulibacter sp.]
MNRRLFLKTAVSLAIAGAAFTAHARKHILKNPCRAPALGALAESPWLAKVWQGLDPAKVWDMHVHLAGIGDSDGGLHVGSRLLSLRHPVLYGQRLAYLNAGCVSGEPGTVDENYVRRLAALARGMPAGVKALLFAFDWYYGDDGRPVPEASTFYVPDAYAARVAEEHPDVFAWAASIHPYAPDAVDRLEEAAARGAKAVKWLPAAQNIDPAAKRCDAFFAALARLRLPLISHCGAEKAAQSASLEHFGNPLRLRRALDAGVRVVVAHCATMGRDEDLDRPGARRTSFDLFARLMERPEWKENLFGDISAIVLRNRKPEVIRALLERDDWHDRLLNGSDYPLPGILPLISPAALARAGLLRKEAVADLSRLREHNPLYFDLALKRNLSWKGKSFPAGVFATRGFFEGDRS